MGERDYIDTDLLVAPIDLERAGACLSACGYHRKVDEPEVSLPGDLATYAFSWRRDGFLIEIHQTLVGVRAPPESAWRVLARDPQELVIEAGTVPVLRPPARAFHLALHAAQNGVDNAKSLEDLRRGIEVLPLDLWRESSSIAAELDAMDAFSAGLALLPEGKRILDSLSIAPTPSVAVQLHASGVRQSAKTLEWMRALPRKRSIRLATSKLVPPPGFMRRWHPLARRSRVGLTLAYLWRPLWLIKELVLGIKERRGVLKQMKSRETPHAKGGPEGPP